MVPTRVSRRPTELRYVGYQVNDVKFLFQTSEQGLNARKDCSGCRPVVAPVYFRIFFEKFVKSAVNGANEDSCSVNFVLFSETSLEGPSFVNFAFVSITVETRITLKTPSIRVIAVLQELNGPVPNLERCNSLLLADDAHGTLLAVAIWTGLNVRLT